MILGLEPVLVHLCFIFFRKRGCEKWSNWNFISHSPLFLTQELIGLLKKRILPPYPLKNLRCFLCRFRKPHLFIPELIEIIANRNQKQFPSHPVQSSSYHPFIPAVVFHAPQGPLLLDGTVHPQQDFLNAFKVFQYFLVHGTEFRINAYHPIFIHLFALGCIGTAAALFTAIVFFLA